MYYVHTTHHVLLDFYYILLVVDYAINSITYLYSSCIRLMSLLYGRTTAVCIPTHALIDTVYDADISSHYIIYQMLLFV